MIPATSHVSLSFLALKRRSINVPIAMMMNERQQSASNIASRIARRFGNICERYSCGICRNACISCAEMKSEKKSPGITRNKRQKPAVKPKLMYTNFNFLFNISGSSIIFFNAIIANKGMVNSAITSIDATVRNLAYIGI